MQNKTLLLAFGTILILFASCKKYYFDSGTHDPKYNGSTLQYMKSKQPFFDSTLVIINLAGLDDVVGKENVTFFAPPSGSVFKSIKRLNIALKRVGKDTVSQLNQIKPEVWRATLSQYIFSGSFLLKDYPQRDTLAYTAYPGQNYSSYGGYIMNVGTIFNDAAGVQYAGYRQLFLGYIPDLSNPQVALQNNPVATSDIQTNNGVLHVLTKSKHNLGFNTDVFIDQVIASGILPPNK
ncbi:fasciclin domain-containing protein [Pedobacter frigoris]|uniref:fasciclin domain-containing protein n=1 Tax=Pedobacter frigoris TaxID=2571272 RepID=UPI00292F6C22|nr:fasciclin domain-containing protein [Pedobacter frigoris]